MHATSSDCTSGVSETVLLGLVSNSAMQVLLWIQDIQCIWRQVGHVHTRKKSKSKKNPIRKPRSTTNLLLAEVPIHLSHGIMYDSRLRNAAASLRSSAQPTNKIPRARVMIEGWWTRHAKATPSQREQQDSSRSTCFSQKRELGEAVGKERIKSVIDQIIFEA
jgi:hypothetical protein